MGFIPAFFLVFFGTLLLIAATYIPLNFLYELAFPPKEYTKKDLDPSESSEEDKKSKGSQDVEQPEN